MPAPYCLLAIAALCFSNPHVKAEVSNFGLGYAVTVTADHYTVSHGMTDVIHMHDFRKSPRACIDKHCLSYHKHCDTKGADMVCNYWLGIPGVVPDGLVTITADSGAALIQAEREVARIGESSLLPFSAMSVQSDAAAPPDCPGDVAFVACAPP
jgi:hypothetical protein